MDKETAKAEKYHVAAMVQAQEQAAKAQHQAKVLAAMDNIGKPTWAYPSKDNNHSISTTDRTNATSKQRGAVPTTNKANKKYAKQYDGFIGAQLILPPPKALTLGRLFKLYWNTAKDSLQISPKPRDIQTTHRGPPFVLQDESIIWKNLGGTHGPGKLVPWSKVRTNLQKQSPSFQDWGLQLVIVLHIKLQCGTDQKTSSNT